MKEPTIEQNGLKQTNFLADNFGEMVVQTKGTKLSAKGGQVCSECTVGYCISRVTVVECFTCSKLR